MRNLAAIMILLAVNSIHADSLKSTTIEDQTFGSASEPLTTGWAIHVVDQPVVVKNCTFHLAGADGIRVAAYGVDIETCRILNNTIYIYSDLTTYGILVGREEDWPYKIHDAEILGNTIIAPLYDDSNLHCLFVGYALSPTVALNHVTGGGYGIGIKGNDCANVFNNAIVQSARQCMIDKAGMDCSFFGNSLWTERGECGRVCNDTDREVAGSTWSNNSFYASEIASCFIINTPVDPEVISSDGNRFYSDYEVIYRIHGYGKTLYEVREEYGMEILSNQYPFTRPETDLNIEAH